MAIPSPAIIDPMLRALSAFSSFLVMSVISNAGTLSSASTIDVVSMCDNRGFASANCSSSDMLGDVAGAIATSSYGSVSGSLSASITSSSGYAGGAFQAEFSDYLIITGDTGPGTLTAAFSIDVNGASASMITGSSLKTLTSSGPIALTSSFTFGDLTPIGGEVQGFGSLQGFLNGPLSFATTADLKLTDIAIFDAAGNPVPGAVVSPQGADVNFFASVPTPIPEPSPWILFLSGVCAIRLSIPAVRDIRPPSARRTVLEVLRIINLASIRQNSEIVPGWRCVRGAIHHGYPEENSSAASDQYSRSPQNPRQAL